MDAPVRSCKSYVKALGVGRISHLLTINMDGLSSSTREKMKERIWKTTDGGKTWDRIPTTFLFVLCGIRPIPFLSRPTNRVDRQSSLGSSRRQSMEEKPGRSSMKP